MGAEKEEKRAEPRALVTQSNDGEMVNFPEGEGRRTSSYVREYVRELNTEIYTARKDLRHLVQRALSTPSSALKLRYCVAT